MFEVSRELRRQNMRMPEQLFLAAFHAPHLPAPHPPISKLPEDEFLERVEYLFDPP